MIIEARKQSSDPAQEALRERKAKWNKKVSEFIDNLIHFKKMINGHPSKFNMEKSRITEPLPKDPNTIIALLASDFNEITTECNEIILQQVNYSQTRRKKQNSNQLEAPPQKTSMLDMHAASFEKEASNALTRFLTKLKGPYFGKTVEAFERRYRLELLSSISDLNKLCSDFQVDIVSKNKESINRANEKMINIEDSLISISKRISVFIDERKIIFNIKDESDEKNEDNGDNGEDEESNKNKKGKKPVANKPDEDKKEKFLVVEKIINDWSASKLSIDIIEEKDRKFMDFLLSKFKNDETDDGNKIELIPQIIGKYEDILRDLNNKLNSNFKSLSEVAKFIIKKTQSYQSHQMNVFAQAALKKWIGKFRYQISPSDKTSATRLSAYESMDRIRAILDEIMNSLEKEFDVKLIKEKLLEVYSNFLMAKKSLNILVTELKYHDNIFKGELGEKVRKSIQQKQIIDFSNRLRK